jgi:ParB family chromosome partitioning protein
VSESAGGKSRGRRGLGRGLDALLPVAPTGALQELDISRIEPNPDQPRQRFEQAALEDLAGSIREHGLVQPLVVARVGDDRYRLIVGERRWRAARIAGVERVPVVVKDIGDRETLEMALVENVQRADLNPLEEAAAYQRLIQDFGLTQQQVAQRVGRSRAAIANTLRLMALPETLKRAVIEGRITEGHARAVLGLTDKHAQLALLERVERDELTVRQTEEIVRRLSETRPPRPRPARPPDIAALEDELRQALGTRVTLRPGKKGGRIVIEYYSDEEFQGLYDRLLDR